MFVKRLNNLSSEVLEYDGNRIQKGGETEEEYDMEREEGRKAVFGRMTRRREKLGLVPASPQGREEA